MRIQKFPYAAMLLIGSILAAPYPAMAGYNPPKNPKPQNVNPNHPNIIDNNGKPIIQNAAIDFSPITHFAYFRRKNCVFENVNHCNPSDSKGQSGYFEIDNDFGPYIHLGNIEDLSKQKHIRLSLTLAGFDGHTHYLYNVNTDDNWWESLPSSVGYYNNGKPPLMFGLREIAVFTQYDPFNKIFYTTLQIHKTVFPQPKGENTYLANLKMDVTNDANNNGMVDPGEQTDKLVPITLNMITEMSLASHCPEPATWAMLIFGFGVVGARTRQLRRLAAA